MFDSAKEQYQQAEKNAIKAKDDAVKQAQPYMDDARQKGSDVRPLPAMPAMTICVECSKACICSKFTISQEVYVKFQKQAAMTLHS